MPFASPPPSFLCLSQDTSRHASAWREDSFQPKDLGWLDSCDEHRNEGGGRPHRPREQLLAGGLRSALSRGNRSAALRTSPVVRPATPCSRRGGRTP
ncbi:MAG TPA: hypothetical protein DCW88_04435 [Agrobacterium sp.]|nr:hypothetical protein EGT36_03825 [Agrobacterium sp. FDAARGOS_525]HAU74788.1 hypothetical protein [Agrobacterium sp.]